MSFINRLHNCSNPYQGKARKVLCVCSAGLLRSPTIAWVLSNAPYEHNTRSAGIHDYALVQVDPVLIEWADEIVFAERGIFTEFLSRKEWEEDSIGKDMTVLDLPDRFAFKDPELIKLIEQQYKESLDAK